MSKKDLIIKSAISAFLAISTTQVFSADINTTPTSEKCYGVARAGMNDCNTATSSCSSSSTKDGQGDAFILLPKGVCERIVGGNLKAPTKVKN